MLPAEGREDHLAEPGNGLSPAISVTAQPKSLRMERGHGKLDLRPLAGVSRSVQGNRVVRHRAGILAVVATRKSGVDRALTLIGRQAYDPPAKLRPTGGVSSRQGLPSPDWRGGTDPGVTGATRS